MADDQVATRAPESDAVETPHEAAAEAQAKPTPSAISSQDTLAQEGPSMGEHCTTDRPVSSSAAKPAGAVVTLNTISCYVTKPSSYPSTPARVLMLLTSGTGIHSINNQLQADAFASHGYVVVMPDQFAGDAAPSTAATGPEDIDPSLLEQVKLRAAETVKSFMIDMWLARHTAEKVFPIVLQAVEGAREEFADAVANGGGVYAAGYCFGAKYVLLLAGEVADGAAAQEGDVEAGEVKREPKIKAGVIAHGTLVTKEDIEGVRVPVSMVCVQNDSLFPDDVREQGRASLQLKAIEHEIEIYEDVPHGFAVLGDYEDAGIQLKQEKAFQQMLGWLEAH